MHRRCSTECLAQLEQPNSIQLTQSLGLVLGDHNPLKTVALFASSSPCAHRTGIRLCRAPCRRASALRPPVRARPPWRAVAHPTPSAYSRRTNLDDDKAGTTTAARNHCSTPCAPVQAAAECDFASTWGESRQFLPHSWIGDRRWYPLSQFKRFTPKLAVFTLAAAARRARIGANTSPAEFTRGQVNTSPVSIQTWPPATQIDLSRPLTAPAALAISKARSHPWR